MTKLNLVLKGKCRVSGYESKRNMCFVLDLICHIEFTLPVTESTKKCFVFLGGIIHLEAGSTFKYYTVFYFCSFLEHLISVTCVILIVGERQGFPTYYIQRVGNACDNNRYRGDYVHR